MLCFQKIPCCFVLSFALFAATACVSARGLRLKNRCAPIAASIPGGVDVEQPARHRPTWPRTCPARYVPDAKAPARQPLPAVILKLEQERNRFVMMLRWRKSCDLVYRLSHP